MLFSMGARLFSVLFVFATLATAQPRVLAVNVDGPVQPITVEVISHALQQAQAEHAALVLVRLSTPGGLLDASRAIVQRMSASPVPIATFVTPSGARAASAGFFLLEAGDIAAMSPGTNTGASSPVLIGQQMDPVMRKKVENDASAWLRSVTTRRGRNAELAEKAITEAKAFTEKEALDQHLIELIASNDRDLIQQLNGRQLTRWDGHNQKLDLAGALIVEARQSLRERIMSAIADPNIGFILLTLGALGIYVEFSSPGLIFPGVFGGILLLLGLSALSVLPINLAGVALLLLAIALLLLEAKVTSHGVLGAGGALAMVLGAVLLIDGPPELRIRWSTALAVSLPFAAITVFLVSLVVRARANKVVTGVSSMLGETGQACTALTPQGQILIRGEYWNAISSAPVECGALVRVQRIDGLTLGVEPVNST